MSMVSIRIGNCRRKIRSRHSVFYTQMQPIFPCLLRSISHSFGLRRLDVDSLFLHRQEVLCLFVLLDQIAARAAPGLESISPKNFSFYDRCGHPRAAYLQKIRCDVARQMRCAALTDIASLQKIGDTMQSHARCGPPS